MNFRAAFDQSQAIVGSARAADRIRVSRVAAQAGAVAAEATLILAASLAGRLLFEYGSGRPAAFDAALGLGIVAALLQAALGRALGLQEFAALLMPPVRRIVLVSIAVVLLLTADLFVLKAGADVSRGFLLTFGVLLVLASLGARLVFARLIAHGVANRLIIGRQAVLIGTGCELDNVPARDLFRQFGLSEIGRVTIPDQQPADAAGYDRAAAEAVRLARAFGAEDLVVAAPWAAGDMLGRLECGLRRSPLPVWLLPDASARAVLARRRPGCGLRLVELQPAPLGAAARIAKRLVDLILATTAGLLLLPLLLLVGLAVRLDSPGPALFRQRRNGFDQRTFVIFKFRTMTVMEDGAVTQAQRGDVRVTRLGRMLRRTSLDELPQLINVLRGDMALVGPRPHALVHDHIFGSEIDDYCVRHHVKPGITGWAQVNGLRGETRDACQMQRRVEHDLWYINNWSLALDLRILLRTCREVLAHDAY